MADGLGDGFAVNQGRSVAGRVGWEGGMGTRWGSEVGKEKLRSVNSRCGFEIDGGRNEADDGVSVCKYE